MKVSEMIKILKQNDCFCLREGDNHEIWYSKRTKKKFPVPRHKSKELPVGTAKSILKAAGIE